MLPVGRWRMEKAERSQVYLDTYMSIACPHLGCRTLGQQACGGLGPAIRGATAIMRAGLRATKGIT